jgi:hypothetical protein
MRIVPTSHVDSHAPPQELSGDSDDEVMLKSYTYAGSLIRADTPLEKAYHTLELLFTENSAHVCLWCVVR